MQKYSHNSRRVQKELGGDVYALSGRVDSIEEDVEDLKSYEVKVVHTMKIRPPEGSASMTIKECLAQVYASGYFDRTKPEFQTWDNVSVQAFGLSGSGYDIVNGDYQRIRPGYSAMSTQPTPNYQRIELGYAPAVIAKITCDLKADTTTGEISYHNTTTMLADQSCEGMDLTFTKGVLS
jgi:hypothetical protein